MNTYQDSHGNRHPQSRIERKIRVAKEKKLEQQRFEHGFNFCEHEGCGKNGNDTYLDCSHQVSVKEAKETGRTELCWTISNIRILCRKCHARYDKNDLQFNKEIENGPVTA